MSELSSLFLKSGLQVVMKLHQASDL